LEVVIDMKKETPVRTVFATFLHNPQSWIFFPDSVIFSLSSNGKKFHSINEQGNDIPRKAEGPVIKLFSQTFPDTPARYIKVRAKNVGTCPDWHEGKGEPCWLFADEIVVY
jgi:hexosaminidase